LRGPLAVPGDDETDVEAHPAVKSTHPFRVAPGEIVVDRDEVNTLAGETVQVGRKRRDEGLALAGLHFGNPPEVQCGAAHQLDVVVALAENTAGCLAGGGEGLDQEVVERLAALETRPELGGLSTKRIVGQSRHRRFEGVDVGHEVRERLDLLAFSGSEDSIEDAHAGADAIGRGSPRPPSNPPKGPLPSAMLAARHATLHPSSSRRR